MTKASKEQKSTVAATTASSNKKTGGGPYKITGVKIGVVARAGKKGGWKESIKPE